jgi:hypothetical protein
MYDVKPEWLAALRAVDDKAELRFNHTVNRWEFLLSHADGILRSQFWGDFTKPRDPVTGLHPYRELNDATMREALANLEKTFIGNRYHHGTPWREAGRAYFENKRLQEERWRKRGEDFADFIWDHRRQLRDAGAGPMVTVTKELR